MKGESGAKVKRLVRLNFQISRCFHNLMIDRLRFFFLEKVQLRGY